MALTREQMKALAIEFAAHLPPHDPSRRKKVPDAAFVQGDFSEGVSMLPVVDKSPRARAIHEISAIVAKTGWTLAVSDFLYQQAAESVFQLSDRDVRKLLRRMRKLVENAEAGCDAEDAFPAR